MPVQINGIGVLSDDEYEAISPKNHFDLMLRLPNGGCLFMGETPRFEDRYLSKGDPDERSRMVTLERFDVRVDLYGYNLRAAEGVAEYVIGLGDSNIANWTPAEFLDLGDAVFHAFQGLADGDRVLVNCQAGLNRSGLVTGLVLIAYGMDPQVAINLIRDNRAPLCLANGSFETFLKEKGREFALAAVALEDS